MSATRQWRLRRRGRQVGQVQRRWQVFESVGRSAHQVVPAIHEQTSCRPTYCTDRQLHPHTTLFHPLAPDPSSPPGPWPPAVVVASGGLHLMSACHVAKARHHACHNKQSLANALYTAMSGTIPQAPAFSARARRLANASRHCHQATHRNDPLLADAAAWSLPLPSSYKETQPPPSDVSSSLRAVMCGIICCSHVCRRMSSMRPMCMYCRWFRLPRQPSFGGIHEQFVSSPSRFRQAHAPHVDVQLPMGIQIWHRGKRPAARVQVQHKPAPYVDKDADCTSAPDLSVLSL